MMQNLNIVPRLFLFNGNLLANEPQPLNEATIFAGIANMYSERNNRPHEAHSNELLSSGGECSKKSRSELASEGS